MGCGVEGAALDNHRVSRVGAWGGVEVVALGNYRASHVVGLVWC